MPTKSKEKKSKSSSNSSGSSTESKAEKAFREEQLALAREQGMTAPNAVPEQRPQAAAPANEVEQSDAYKKLKKSGKLQDEPMPKSAYDKANSKEQLEKAEKNSVKPSIREGAIVRITKGEYEGSVGAVVGVTYKDFDETQKARSGVPEVANYAEVSEIRVRTRGSRHALVSLKEGEYEETSTLGIRPNEEA